MTTLVSLLFITIIPINCKITNCSLYLFVCFLKDHHNYFLASTQLLISGKSISRYASYSLIFSPLRSIINREQHEKYLYNQSRKIWNVWSYKRALHSSILKWVCCVICITMLCFAFSSCCATFKVKNNIISIPASSALTLVLHQSHNACTTNRLTYMAVKKGMELKGKLQ